MSPGSRSRFWFCWFLLSLSLNLNLNLNLSSALDLQDLFEFGIEAGDKELHPGEDSTAELRLNGSLFFFSDQHQRVYINTNGFVSVVKPAAETEYLGKMPAKFQMMAALLGDLDHSDGQGSVFYRLDSSEDALSRASGHIAQAFPRDNKAKPHSVLVVTWVNMTAQGSPGPDAKKNTFQLVVVLMESSSCAILLYPTDGLQFLYTSIGGDRKLLEAGFNQGLVNSWFNPKGTYFQTTTDKEASVRELTKKTNSGRKGVWVYEIGPSGYLTTIIPGIVLEEEKGTTESPMTMLPRQPEETDFTTYQMPEETETPNKDQTDNPEDETISSGNGRPETEDELDQFVTEFPGFKTVKPTYSNTETVRPSYSDQTELTDPYATETKVPTFEAPYTSPDPSKQEYPRVQTGYPDPVLTQPQYTSPEPTEPEYSTVKLGYPDPDTVQPQYTSPEPSEPEYSTVKPWYPDSDPVQPRHINPEPARPVPPHSHPYHPQIIVVDEDEDLDVNVFAYNSETCVHNRHKCSAFADCQDYSYGYCCHCRPGYYGNGKDCVPDGKPQRMNGKVNGRMFVGGTPVELSNNDLHSYVVINDGRAYVAISNIPKSVGPSLQPLSSLGGVIGWAFALEQPESENGFSLIGAVFSRQADVIFQPGNERLSIRQKFEGIDEHDHLVVSTELDGSLPALPLGSSVQIDPYKEIYHYDRNLITSSSNRDYSVTFPDGTVEARTYQWRQTITFQTCPHNEATRAALSTQQLSVDQIFAWFDEQNELIRYAMTNKIGQIHSGAPEQNPCFTGRHGCDINAACRSGDGLDFTCVCMSGFTGDGRYCHEEVRAVDHCQTGSHDCDVPERAACTYSGGSAYSCSCLPGFEGDGRVCRDKDECRHGPCHRDAFCSNTPGSYVCRCHPGFHGDGLQCSPMSTEREKTLCERQRDSASASASASTSRFFSFFRPQPAISQYIPQCDEHGSFESTQCHSSIQQCWCVDANGQEIPNTRTGPGSTPLCIDQAVTPPPVGPTPRPDVHPVAPGSALLFAQSGKIEHVPLDGYDMKKDEAKALLHIPDRVVIAVAYDCVEKMVYWTDITGPSISKASLSGGDVLPVITKELQSPEGLALDPVSRLLFWTDSMRDTVEVSRLDGSHRRVLFHSDLVNPRPIVADPAYGRIYWADWDRDGPKIEMSNMDGTERTILVKDNLGLPNGLTFDLDTQQLCWADAGTRVVECFDLHQRQRRRILDGIQYPFGLVSFGRKLYYTDWRREAVVAVDRSSETETEEFLPQKRSRLYGIATATTHCPQVYNYCADAGCSHLCLPRHGGFTCRCPDAVAANDRCEERNP
ncbi:nidogen-1-like [Solea solea]|uniref:nidogen-1-like n=1 Tax=Solea solea TaxID=90069 RepID=UPI00272D530A|nr:nidogen-1-like [Solea solea]